MAGADGARGGGAQGTTPPQGGSGGADGESGNAGEGAVASIPEIVNSGTTVTGGGGDGGSGGFGTAPPQDGEIQISYKSLNDPPSITTESESPADGTTGISFDPTLSIEVTDSNGDSMDVTFYDDSNDSQIGSTQTGVADGGTASVTWSGRDFDTTYDWYVVIDDGKDTTTSATFSFTTVSGIPQNVQITDAQTEGKLTVDWDEVGSATGYYVYRAESSGSAKADYTQVADVSSPPYVDQNLEDGERYYYRVSAYN